MPDLKFDHVLDVCVSEPLAPLVVLPLTSPQVHSRVCHFGILCGTFSVSKALVFPLSRRDRAKYRRSRKAKLVLFVLVLVLTF